MVVQDIFSSLSGDETILIMNGGENAIDKTFFYLTGAESGLFEHSAVVADDSRIQMFVLRLEEQSARQTGHEVTVLDTKKQLQEAVIRMMSGRKEIWLNLDSLTANMYSGVKSMFPDAVFKDASSAILKARMTKSSDEKDKLREAAKIGSEIYLSVIGNLKEGMKETDLAAELVHAMMRNGASGPSFMPIVGFGSNSSIPHYFPGDRKLRRGDFVLTDYGAIYRRYCSDITRTAVFGRANDKQNEMYETVRRAQTESMRMIRSGVNGRLVDRKALDIIDSTKFRGRFMHGLGHGIGLEVHDHPAMSRTEDTQLNTDMVITVEPGIYIPDYGGVRIEDDVIVKSDGYEKITLDSPHDLMEV